jgi:hypothetical protein
LGQTGTGKSGSLELLTISDIYYDQGFAVIDPHGDYAQNVLKYIPRRRIDDVVYFNPADTDHPIGFNPLEVTDKTLKGHISSELVGVLKRLFAESWGPRLEYILRYTLLALLDYPNATMLDVTRMLTDKKFRANVITYIDDPVVKNFWVTEFAAWNDKFASEAVAPVLNKVGAFTANPMIRNIIGQPKSTFNIRKIMDEGKILVVNLSRGLMGEDNAGILGAMMVTKIQLAAMGRADMHESKRRPFYLYVDEFQNFATDSFAVILSEARKYGLNLTVANQYISQMSQPVRDAVFGNVGTIISFRVSPDDSPFLTKYFEPQFEAADLIQMHNRHFMISMTITGEKAPPFSAKTLNLPEVHEDCTADIIEITRARYTKDKAEVDALVRHNTLGMEAISAAEAPKALPEGQGPARTTYVNNLNKIDALIAQETHSQQTAVPAQPPQRVARAITGLINPVLNPDDPAKKKKTRRGGKNRNKNKPDPAAAAPTSGPREEQSSDGHTLRLR